MTTIDTTSHPKFEAQLQLEENMRSLGIDRFREQLQKAREKGTESRTQAVRRLMGHHHQNMVEAIEAFMTHAKTGKAGKAHTAVKFFDLVGDNDVLAHLTSRVVLDSVSTSERLQRAATELATLIEDEVHFRAFQKSMPGAFRKLSKNAGQSSNERYRRNAILMPARKLGVDLNEWSPTEKVRVGTKLIELFCLTTGLATINRQSAGGADTPINVQATPETLKWIEDENNRTEWMSPIYLPTIIPPKPWTTPFDGGYWSGRVRRLTLVKTKNRQYLNELGDRDMSVVYEAVNALQDTPWSINQRVLAVMEELWANRSTIGKIPSQAEKDDVMPKRPTWLSEGMTKDEMTEDQRVQFRKWKQERSQAHESLAKATGKRIAFSRMLSVARRFKDHEELFFPHQLDWRGRIYPCTLYLTPQGNDAQRGLLEFARSVALTDEDGVNWLAIHGAGLWGVDKVDMETRRAWVEAHSDEIVASAEDPFDNRFWATAEKPWQALAFCFDWAGWKTEGYAYESSLPVQMDGTCNGLQNFSAILRDEIGGAAVNLVPSDKPQDIYQRVADVVSTKVEADLDNEERVKIKRKQEDGTTKEIEGPRICDMARAWHGNITRKVTKRPVMTLAYGASEIGFRTQVFDDTVNPWKSEKPETYPFESMAWEAASYMGKLIWDSVSEVVVAATSAMEWLQQAARAAAKEGLPVNWTTPTGFMVQQAYHLPNTTRINLMFDEVRVQLSVALDSTPKLDKRKQAAGISPNWVHSLDASHMMRTINKCNEMGIRSFSMIHDSYGTHAGNAAVMATTLREEFVEMYQQDVLAKFRDDLLVQLPEGAELPDLPPKGNLDLSLVLQSPFFFA